LIEHGFTSAPTQYRLYVWKLSIYMAGGLKESAIAFANIIFVTEDDRLSVTAVNCRELQLILYMFHIAVNGLLQN